MRKKIKPKKLNISNSRKNLPYTLNEYVGRILWSLVLPLFRFSPRPLFGWRNFLLRLFGAKIGKKVHIYPSTRVYLPWNLIVGDETSIGEWVLLYNLGLIKIGKQSTISHCAHLCAGTHDYNNYNLPLLRHTIEIGSQVWICSNAFIGPSIKIGNKSIIAAAAVVVKNVADKQIVGGNPAKYLKKRKLKL